MKEKKINLKQNNIYLDRSKKALASASTFNKLKLFDTGKTPFCIIKGKGPYTWDVDGNKYIDYIIGLGTMTLGHNHPIVNNAINEQLRNGISFSLPTILEIEVAEMLIQRLPSAERVKFGKNGNDVTSAAVRIARYYTGRDHILFCGYHGWQDWYIGQTSKNGGIPKCVRRLSHRFIYNDINSVTQLIKKYKNNVACIILEPIIARERPSIEFLKEIRVIATKNKIILIFDEIVTGFRFHKAGAQGLFNIIPDLSCFGKALANGMPLSVLVGKARIMTRFDNIFFSLTNAGESLSLAAAKAVIRFYDQFDVPGRLAHSGRMLKAGLERLVYKYGFSHRIRITGQDCRFGLEFIDKDNPDYDSSQDLLYWTKLVTSYGILSGGGHMLSYAHTEKVVNQTLEIYEKIFSRLKEKFDYKKGNLLGTCFIN